VITRCITRSTLVPGTTIRASEATLNLCLRPSPAAPGTGPATLTAEPLGRVRAELPVIGHLEEREQVIVSVWLTGLWSARTRCAYATDAAARSPRVRRQVRRRFPVLLLVQNLLTRARGSQLAEIAV
jgi:hypothetical protein